jgi:hypothetical protein
VSGLQIEAVSSRRSVREFIDLPNRLYLDLPNFVPPLQVDRSMLLDPKHSVFWKRAQVCYWLARRNGRLVGRISAQVDPVVPLGLPPGTGMFGCLDAEDDLEVTSGLVAAAERWLREQGCATMFGPCTLHMNEEPGLLVEGSHEPPMIMSPWHPPYLNRHLEALGLGALHDLHSWRLDLDTNLPEARDGRLRIAERIPGLRVRHPDRRSFSRDVGILCDVYNDGWRDNWGFIPLNRADVAGLEQLMKWLLPREAFTIIELHGKPVAAMLLLPNLFELSQGLSARPGVSGWIKWLWRAWRHRFASGRIIVVGIAQELQTTILGGAVAALLIDKLISGQDALKGNWVEAGWVLEDNLALIQILERFNFRRNKTFRLFSKSVAGGEPQCLHPAAIGA